MWINKTLLTCLSILTAVSLTKAEILPVQSKKLLQQIHPEALATENIASVDGSNIKTLREIFEIRWIPAASMANTLQGSPQQWQADFVLIDKTVYDNGLPKRGDIIIFKPNDNLTKEGYTDPFIKRVIALPGEKVELRKGKVYINNKLLPESYIDSKQVTNIDVCASGEQPPFLSKSQTLPPNSYLVLGDNRQNSYDSRCWGLVPRKNIIGQAVRRVWPLSTQINLDKNRHQQQHYLEELFLKNVGFIIPPNNLNDGIAFFQKQLANARKNQDMTGEITALRHLSMYNIMLGIKNEQAMNYAQQLLKVARQHKISGAETQALAYMSLAAFAKLEPNLAIEYGQQVLPLAQKNQDQISEYMALWSLAIAHVYSNDCSQAKIFYDRSSSILNSLPVSENKNMIQEQMSVIFKQLNIQQCLGISNI
ncbi:signal peptidase I [Nostoc sp. CMAA1605]|uniref:signal peptidase I n=1 Tax=Nostoc sp. CMAA1605 TaxID=2055159 RepID=UPI002E315F8C|nr:signal peptidase I [Nostoc sp. CMAA1605]